jgi:hypothetical protein
MRKLILVTVVLVAVANGQTQIKVPRQRAVLRQSSLPKELQSGLSAAFGQDSLVYSTQASRDGFDITNLRQKLNIHFKV